VSDPTTVLEVLSAIALPEQDDSRSGPDCCAFHGAAWTLLVKGIEADIALARITVEGYRDGRLSVMSLVDALETIARR
jgi:hypothetical protein